MQPHTTTKPRDPLDILLAEYGLAPKPRTASTRGPKPKSSRDETLEFFTPLMGGHVLLDEDFDDWAAPE